MSLDELLDINGYAASLSVEDETYSVSLLAIPSITGKGKKQHEAMDDASNKLSAYITIHPNNVPEPDYKSKLIEIYDGIYKEVIDVCHDSYVKWDRQTIAEQYLMVLADLSYVDAEPTGNIKRYLDILLHLFIAKS